MTALKNANKLVFNLAPGMGTEVIALFDLDLLAKGRPGVRAVHIFTERRKPPAPARASEPTPSLRPSMAPLVAGALAIVLIIFGVVGVVRKLQEPPPADVQGRGHRRRRRVARRAGAHRHVGREAEGRAQGLELRHHQRKQVAAAASIAQRVA